MIPLSTKSISGLLISFASSITFFAFDILPVFGIHETGGWWLIFVGEDERWDEVAEAEGEGGAMFWGNVSLTLNTDHLLLNDRPKKRKIYCFNAVKTTLWLPILPPLASTSPPVDSCLQLQNRMPWYSGGGGWPVGYYSEIYNNINHRQTTHSWFWQQYRQSQLHVACNVKTKNFSLRFAE